MSKQPNNPKKSSPAALLQHKGTCPGLIDDYAQESDYPDGCRCLLCTRQEQCEAEVKRDAVAQLKLALTEAAESACDVRRCYRCPVQNKCPKPPWPKDYEVVEELWVPYYLAQAEKELADES